LAIPQARFMLYLVNTFNTPKKEERKRKEKKKTRDFWAL
jgi:hypothetical protein